MNATQLRSEIVEATARGIDADGWAWFDATTKVDPKHAALPMFRARSIANATAALTALLTKLGECGWKVVSKTPTSEMLSEGQKWIDWCGENDETPEAYSGWANMIAAAPELLQVEE